MTWSKQTWERIIPIYESIIAMPFITELMDGSLAMEKFQFYMAQDSGYLEHFGRALAMIGAKAPNVEEALAFIQFGQNAILVENALHESYFKDFGISSSGKLEPTCHHYIHYLKSTAAYESVEIAMAAVLPCFWIYREVGNYIYQHQKAKNNPYQKWIDTYAGEEFGIAVTRAIEICDRAAVTATPSTQKYMTEAFITASRMEFEFWDSAYQIKKWKFS